MPSVTEKKRPVQPINAYIGQKIKALRLMKSWSQQRLASALCITFQQVQKYEKGITPITVSRLVDICRAFDIPVSSFLAEEDLCNKKKGLANQNTEILRMSNDVIKLTHTYARIKSPKLKKKLQDLASVLAETEDMR